MSLQYRFPVDDGDSNLAYEGSWAVSQDNPAQYGSTSHGTNRTGDKVTLSFYGDYIHVFGTIEADPQGVAQISATYSLDGADASATQSPTYPNVQYQQLLWSSGMITTGQHNLTITVVTAANGYYWLDYVAYTVPLSAFDAITSVPGAPQPSLTATSPANLNSSSPSKSTSTSTQLPAPTEDTGSSSNSARGISTGEIVGVVIGGVAILALTALLVVWYKKLAARYAARQHQSDHHNNNYRTHDIPRSMSSASLSTWDSAQSLRSYKDRVSRLSVDLTRSMSLNRRPSLVQRGDISGIIIQRHEVSIPDFALPLMPSPTSSRHDILGSRRPS